MQRAVFLLFLLTQSWAQPALIDRIAVVVDQSIIKDSDIERDLRVMQFLNNEPLHISPAERKKGASKLIDQVFLRNEIRMGSYPQATLQESTTQLEALIKQRFHSQAALRSALERYGLDEATLLEEFRWQLTVLTFINARFRPAVLLPDAAVDKYYQEHLTALRKENPRGSDEDLRSKARDTLTDEEVNRLFFTWLDEHRKSAKINFHEDGLS